MFRETPLVVDFGNLFWECPLVVDFSNLAQECPLVANLDIMLGSALGGRFQQLVWREPPGGQFWQPILQECPLVTGFC